MSSLCFSGSGEELELFLTGTERGEKIGVLTVCCQEYRNDSLDMDN